MPIDYKNSKIYCIRSHQTDKIYIGSTTQTLAQRLAAHRKNFKCYPNGKTSYTTSFKILEYKDAYIELICNCPCNNVEELRRIEGKYIREKNCVNKFIAGRTDKEYYQDTKNTTRKEYLEKNKERFQLYRKDYYIKHQIKKNEYNKVYYKENKEKLNKIKREKRKKEKPFICPCGGKYKSCRKGQHFRTKKHQNYINSLTE